ncbi:MAG TPA: hypothetical protein VGD66_06405 [Allosphingosinicella sp.]
MATRPPRRPTGGTAVLLILVLLVVVAALGVWGWSKAPPARPNPAATANPTVPPPSAAPAQPHR